MGLVTFGAQQFFRGASALRHARAFHSEGIVVRASALVEEPDSALGAAVGVGEHDAVVRFSRGIGLPDAWPDILGAALRILPAARPGDGPEHRAENGPGHGAAAGPEAGRGNGTVVDLLMTTVGPSGPGSLLLRPVRRWASHPYSTLMPYETPFGTRILGLRPLEDDMADASLATLVARLTARPSVLELVERSGRGPWRTVGRLVVTAEQVPERDHDFDPMLHATATVHPVRFLRSVRAAAYRGSRRGRGAVSIHP